MSFSPTIIPELTQSVIQTIENNSEEVTALDQAIGDGDHVTNLQRGLQALMKQSDSISQLDWSAAFKETGMLLMSTIGGASGSLYGTLFISMSKAVDNDAVNPASFAEVYKQGVDAVKQLGKADIGEKTMLDVHIPVSQFLQQAEADSMLLDDVLVQIKQVAIVGMESTREMIATKGRASFLGERSKGHIDAGARTSQLMICAIVDVLIEQLT